MPRIDRIDLISRIEERRGSSLICYVCGDRPGVQASIADDAVWPMYDQVRSMGMVDALDLFLYSRGGDVDVPWRIVSMLREHCKRLNVLIPYRAHSAATMIALGCDHIYMTRKAELGPIDPAVSKAEKGTAVPEHVRVEDVMAFVDFMKDKAGLGDQRAIASNVKILSEKLTPWGLGSIYRTHTHIRDVARKLLLSRVTKPDERKTQQIVEALAEKIYLHNHSISRTEACELGLPVEHPDPELEELLWNLLKTYGSDMLLRVPLKPEDLLGQQNDEGEGEPIDMAMVESRETAWSFRATPSARRQRQAPTNMNVTVNLGLQLPPGLDQSALNQEAIRQLMQQFEKEVPALVQQQVRQQSPVVGMEFSLREAYWREITDD